MNQTRALLLFAWLFVAALLWMEWGKERAAPPPAPPVAELPDASTSTARASPDSGTVPTAPDAATAPPTATAAEDAPAATVTLSNDVLRLTLDARGGRVLGAELLKYAQTSDDGSPPVKLLDSAAAHYFVAEIGLIAARDAARPPSHEDALTPENPAARAVALSRGSNAASLAFVWRDPASGLRLRRVYALERGSYAVTVRDEVRNRGSRPWAGHVYRQLVRVPPAIVSGGISNFNNPEAFSFAGAAWYSPEDKFEKRKFSNFEDGPLDAAQADGKPVTGGWVAMLQHHFLAAWVPAAKDAAKFSLGEVKNGQARYLVREVGPALSVAPGAQADTEARLWIGPKLPDRLEALAPGLDLTLDYGIFTFLAQPIYWLLSWLHALVGNWGWSIVLLVLLIKLALYKLSETQYKSFAKMRRLQPRIEALKERYGDDRQKFQMAMMELYKKEKANPASGCLPILVQIPVFLALYWVLLESVELRHAVWIPGWIDNLTARDPFFILPIVNMAVMWFTQKLTPAPGMDPLQKKMMQAMPLVFGVMFAFFPAGLVLYWCTNGLLGLAQQWWLMRRYGDKAPAVPAKT